MGKLTGALCMGLYNTIALHLPKSNAKVLGKGSKAIRCFLARRYIRHCGKNANLQKGAIFSSRLSIGDNSSIGIRSVIQGTVTIGNDVMMGPEVYIYTKNHNHNRTDIPMIQQGYEDEKPVIVEDDVWIGSRVTILPGITVGKGSILGASAVVVKDVPPYSVVAGNPAKVVKSRLE